MATPATKTGLFIVAYNIGTSLPGAPHLNLHLAVNTVDEAVTGQGQVTQAVNPPVDVRTNVQGDFTYMTVMPNNTHILVTLTGTQAIQWPSTGGIGPVLPPNFSLRMVLASDWKSGTANYKYQVGNTWHEVKDVPVKASTNL